MAMGEILKRHLDGQGVVYRLLAHPHTGCSMETAEAAGLPGAGLAKGVVLGDADGRLMVVLPAVHHVELGTLHRALGRALRQVPETELAALFPDCEPGAVPPLAGAYGLPWVWDEALLGLESVYFEAGDHEHLVHLSGADFVRLMGSAPWGRYSHHL